MTGSSKNPGFGSLTISEIATVHLVKTYCLPSVMNGGEVWSLSKAEYQKMNVMWNNCFQKYLIAVGVKMSLHFCSIVKCCLCHMLLTSELFYFGKNY